MKDLFNEVSWAGLESDTEAFKIIAKMAKKLSKASDERIKIL